MQPSVCLTAICSCWPTFSLCLNFYSPQAAASRSQRRWGNNQYCSHFNSLATEKAKLNLKVFYNKPGQQTALFKLQLHYNYKAVGKRLIDILIGHECRASTCLSSVPFCRVLGRCQSRLQKNLSRAAGRRHNLPDPENRVLSGIEADQPKHACTCALHVCMQVWWGRHRRRRITVIASYDAERVVCFNSEGNFSFPPQNRIPLFGMENGSVSLPWVFPR